jgi:hypothetical protein
VLTARWFKKLRSDPGSDRLWEKFCVFGVFSGLYASPEMLVEHPAGYPVYLPLIRKTE